MSKERRAVIGKYAITGGIGIAFVAFYLSNNDLSMASRQDQYRILCDAFTLPGLFMLLLGAMIVMNNLGALDLLAYGMRYVVHLIVPSWDFSKQSYYDYVEERRNKRVKGFGFLFVVGGILFGIGLIFLALFYHVYLG